MCDRISAVGRGSTLVEALVALGLLALVASSVASLLHLAVQTHREASRIDQGLLAAETILARTAAVSFHRLPQFFGAAGDAFDGRVDTGAGDSPADWPPLVEGLPGGRIIATLQALGPAGAPVRFEEAVALRIRVRVGWSEKRRDRSVELTDVRF